MIFQKPWPGTNYLLSGKLSALEISQLLCVAERSGLKVFGNTTSADPPGGLSLLSSHQKCVGDNCRRLLEVFANDSSKIAVQGVNSTVSFVPPDIQGMCGE